MRRVILTIALATISLLSYAGNSDIRVEEDFIAFEAESAISPIGKNWAIRRVGDPAYDQITGDLPAVNGTYIEYMAGTNEGLKIKPGVDSIAYRFTPKSDGVYTLTGRTAQQLHQPEGEATAEERAVLQRYCGFGGLKAILNPADTLADALKWSKSDQELFPQVV